MCQARDQHETGLWKAWDYVKELESQPFRSRRPDSFATLLICSLPKETAEEFWQETVRIMKGSCKHKVSMIGAERLSLQALEVSEELTVLPHENMTVVLSTVHCNWKITVLLEDQA